MKVQPGVRLGPYVILSQIGLGGMGEVYRARDERLDREVAVKVLTGRLAEDAEALRRFEVEAKAVAALSHPNILSIHEFDYVEGIRFAVMELLEGQTLREFLDEKPVPWRKTVQIAISVCEGLSAAHAKGIVHRDLKPENIFITDDGQVKILDFGLAQTRSIPSESRAENPPDRENTQTQDTVLGTVGYASPEQVRAEVVDARTDIFSLGCILYEMVTGRRAFYKETVFDTVSAILREDPPDIPAEVKVPLELHGMIRHALEKNPRERFQSSRDLAFQLRTLLLSADISGVVPSSKSVSKYVHAALALLLGLVAISILATIFAGKSSRLNSIAVLPFENSSHEEKLDYLCDGIPESIIFSLSRLENLRVLAHTSTFRYKGPQVDIKRIRKDLNADVILTGSLTSQGNHLIVRAALIDAADGSGMWGEQYSLMAKNILEVQEEISRKIVETLRLQLTPSQKLRMAKSAPENTDAYHLYLKGRYCWNIRNAENIRKAIEYFRDAVDADPGYALAYAGLADCYSLLGGYVVSPPEEVYPKAKAFAEKALEFDPDLAEAHTSLGHIYMYYREWQKAEDAFRKALVNRPSYSTAHHWYANFLAVNGRTKEALDEIRRAMDLDPLSQIIQSALGYNYYLDHQFEKAVEQESKVIETDREFAPAHAVLGAAYRHLGDFDQSIHHLEEAISLSGGNTDHRAELAITFVACGRRQEAVKILQELLHSGTNTYVSPVFIAAIYVALGQKRDACLWLEKGFQARAEYMTFLGVEPNFDAIRSEPEFQEILKRMGLPQPGR